MKKIIAITGTHGTGKTTLAFKLAAHYKQLGHNVKVIQEVARRCPFPINENMTLETTFWIYHEHSKMELEAQKDHDVVICDRTFYDSFVYANVKDLSDQWFWAPNIVDDLTKYKKIIFVRPDMEIGVDGVRCNDQKFQSDVDIEFSHVLRFINPIELKSSDIFSPEETWKQYCLEE